MKKKFTLITSLGLMMLSTAYAAQTIYVTTPANGGSDSNVGSVTSPYATLAKATSMVVEDGTIINIAAGTYVATTPAVLNAYDQTIIGDNAATSILDGNNSVSLIDGYASMHNSGKTITIKKLAFKNAFLTDVTGVKDGGAAISIGVKTNLVLEDCIFANNAAGSTTIGFAGAVYFCGNNITVNRCFFEQNASNSSGTQGYGGAITVRHLFNVDAAATSHISYGATYAAIKNSTFYRNGAFSKGGAVYFNKQLDTKVDDDDATFVVQNCDFVENTSSGGTVSTNAAEMGAGLAISSGSNSTNNKGQTIILTNNTFCNNSMLSASIVYGKNAILLEGFRYTAYLANNILTSSATNGESIFANQPAPIESGSNNIIDKINTNIDGTDFNANAATKYNQVVTITAATIGLNTTLVNYPIGSSFAVPYLALQTGSMAINAGTNSYLINTVANPSPSTPTEFVLQSDIRDQFLQSSRDLGAYEFNSTATDLKTNSINTIECIKNMNGFMLNGLNRNDNITIYNPYGRTIFKASSTGSQLQINLVTKGVYIICVNDLKNKYMY